VVYNAACSDSKMEILAYQGIPRNSDSEARIKQFPKALIEELLQVEINRHLGATLRVLRRQKGLAQRLL